MIAGFVQRRSSRHCFCKRTCCWGMPMLSGALLRPRRAPLLRMATGSGLRHTALRSPSPSFALLRPLSEFPFPHPQVYDRLRGISRGAAGAGCSEHGHTLFPRAISSHECGWTRMIWLPVRLAHGSRYGHYLRVQLVTFCTREMHFIEPKNPV